MQENTVASGTFTARPGKKLHAAIIEAAKSEGVAVSSWINDVLSRSVGWLPVIPRTLKDLIDLRTLDEDQAERLKAFHQGVAIVAGPVNAGKTTLIQAILRATIDAPARVAIISPTIWEYFKLSSRSRSLSFYDDSTFLIAEPKEIAASLVRRNFDTIVFDEIHGPYIVTLAETMALYSGQRIIIGMHGSGIDSVLPRLDRINVQLDARFLHAIAYLEKDKSTGIVRATVA